MHTDVHDLEGALFKATSTHDLMTYVAKIFTTSLMNGWLGNSCHWFLLLPNQAPTKS